MPWAMFGGPLTGREQPSDSRLPAVTTIVAALREARARLAATGGETPGLDAEVLLRHVLGHDRASFLARLSDEIRPEQLEGFRGLVAERAAGTPVAYLTGEREFMGFPFIVGPGVLVPRPETEILVEWALARLRNRPTSTVVDVGTGSGAIALSLGALLGNAWPGRMIAADVSAAALQTAVRNRERLGLEDRVALVQGSLIDWLRGPVDLLLANLPYLRPEQIADNPELAAEPRLALDGGGDGLDLIRRLLADAPRVLAPGGAVGLEIDPGQRKAVTILAQQAWPNCPSGCSHRSRRSRSPRHRRDHVSEVPIDTSATMRPDTGVRAVRAVREGLYRVDFVDIDAAPEALLRALGKDARLVSYGGANFGMPLDLIEPAQTRIVPNDKFFVRSNGPVPIIDPATWRLSVHGTVAKPLSLSLADLQALPAKRLEAFLECAGNGRTRFAPVPPGTPWGNDAVGNALWEGVSLSHVLDRAGVRAETVDLVTHSADFPGMQRGLPIAVASNPETMLVWTMNGEPLPIAHGGPVRLLVPGWAGIASTKWLTGLEAIDRAFDGFWNVDNYVFWDERGDPLRPIAEMPPKSLIATPRAGADRSRRRGHDCRLGMVRVRSGARGCRQHRWRRIVGQAPVCTPASAAAGGAGS